MNIAVAGVFNPSAYRDARRVVARERPDVVHIHNVYPNFSPSILAACRAMGVPTIFHVHCHVLTCPNWYHLRDGKSCDLCFGGREHWCLLTNCRDSLAESAAYALRSFVAHKFGLFQKNVTLFIAVSNFLRDRLISAGYPGGQIEVVHNAVCIDNAARDEENSLGEYIAYAGRLSPEKGVDTLIAAARTCSLPVKIAGDGPEMGRLRAAAPGNVAFLGRLDADQLRNFYRRSRFIVIPSRSYETFSLVAAEAMAQGKALIASRIGALPELIADGIRGLLIETGDEASLALKMRLLWENPPLCDRLGTAARIWAEEHCREDVFYARLMKVYSRAIGLTNGARQHDPVPTPEQSRDAVIF
jgi:glycosyltransferase involved in cell wall biosynthesis